MDVEESILTMAKSYLQEIVYPQAEAIDCEPEALKNALQGMGNRSLLALRVPRIWGGSQLNEIVFYRLQMMVARYSGALALLQIQHQSAAFQLVATSNQSLKQKYLPCLAKGKILLGLGVSQLRRQGEPLVKAISVNKKYVLTGKVPWISGFNFFQEFIIGAVLPTGEELYALVPFQDTQQNSGGKISFSQPMKMAAMSATNTVNANLKNWLLTEEMVVKINPPQTLHQNDQKNVLNHGFFALGCAEAGVDILALTTQHKKLPFLQLALHSFKEELTSCRQAMFEALLSENKSFEEKLKLRVWAINLAGRCSQAAIIVASGAANSQEHPAQRVYREALLFSVFGQTTAVMEASLQRLLSKI